MGNNTCLSSTQLNCNTWLDMQNNIITNLPLPVNPNDAVNKEYVDKVLSSAVPFMKITPIPGLTANTVHTALEEINNELSNYLPLSGGMMYGPINMSNNCIMNVKTPTSEQITYAANVQYIENCMISNSAGFQQHVQTIINHTNSIENSLSQSYIPLEGGSLKGTLEMNNNSITGVNMLSNDSSSAANVQYVINQVESLDKILSANQATLSKSQQTIETVENSLKASYVPISGGKLTGILKMNNHFITGVKTLDSDNSSAASVEYVSNQVATLTTLLSSNQESLSKCTQKLKNIEHTLSDSYLPLSGGSMKGPINMNGHFVIQVASLPPFSENVDTSQAASVQYVTNMTATLASNVQSDEVFLTSSSKLLTEMQQMLSEDKYLSLSGGSMTTPLYMNNNLIAGLKTPTSSQTSYAANVEYVSNKVNPLMKKLTVNGLGKLSSLRSYMPNFGGTMTGALNMNNNFIEGVKTLNNDPSSAVSVQHVNDLVYNVKNNPFYFVSQNSAPSLSLNEFGQWISSEASNTYIYSHNLGNMFFSFENNMTQLMLKVNGLYLFTFSFYNADTEKSCSIVIDHLCMGNDNEQITSTNVMDLAYHKYKAESRSFVISVNNANIFNHYLAISAKPALNTSVNDSFSEPITLGTTFGLIWYPL